MEGWALMVSGSSASFKYLRHSPKTVNPKHYEGKNFRRTGTPRTGGTGRFWHRETGMLGCLQLSLDSGQEANQGQEAKEAEKS